MGIIAATITVMVMAIGGIDTTTVGDSAIESASADLSFRNPASAGLFVYGYREC
jgi:hypothetical protein